MTDNFITIHYDCMHALIALSNLTRLSTSKVPVSNEKIPNSKNVLHYGDN